MSTQTKIHIIAIIVIVLLMIVKGISEFEPTVPLMTEDEKDAAFEEALEFYGKPTDVSVVPFGDIDINGLIDNPTFKKPDCTSNPDACISLGFGPLGFGLAIQVPTPCVDTFELEDVSCADKAAIIRYRKAINDIEVKRLQKEIDEMEHAPTYDGNIITDPGTVEV